MPAAQEPPRTRFLCQSLNRPQVAASDAGSGLESRSPSPTRWCSCLAGPGSRSPSGRPWGSGRHLGAPACTLFHHPFLQLEGAGASLLASVSLVQPSPGGDTDQGPWRRLRRGRAPEGRASGTAGLRWVSRCRAQAAAHSGVTAETDQARGWTPPWLRARGLQECACGDFPVSSRVRVMTAGGMLSGGPHCPSSSQTRLPARREFCRCLGGDSAPFPSLWPLSPRLAWPLFPHGPRRLPAQGLEGLLPKMPVP